MTPNPFAEEVARILGAGSGATMAGELAAGEPAPLTGEADQQAPFIEPEEQPGHGHQPG